MNKKNIYLTQSIAKAPSHRTSKIAEEIRQILARIILAGDMPCSKKTYGKSWLTRVSVTHVDVSADLQHAKVYIMPPEEGMQDALMVLKENAWYLRKMLSQSMTTKFTPALRFSIDETLEKSKRLDDLLNKVSLDTSTSQE